jgi:RNA polymerase sigma-70 factor, ECF subfamily
MSSSAKAAAAAAMTRPRPALADLFRDHARFVWRVLLAHGVRKSDVNDATQEVFIVVHRRIDDWDPEQASARAWLHAIAIRIAANHRRRAHLRRETSDENLEPQISSADPCRDVERSRLREKLYEILGTLPAEEREVLVLFELQGVPIREIAEIVGSPSRTVYKRLYTARRAVADALRSGGDHDSG